MANRSLPLANIHNDPLMEQPVYLRDEQALVLPSLTTNNKLYGPNSRQLQCIFMHEEQATKNAFAIPFHEGDGLPSLQLYIKEHSGLRIRSHGIEIWKLHEPIPWDRIDDEPPVRCREISKFAKILMPGEISKQFPENHPPKGYLHVVVQLPKAKILNDPLERTPPMPPADVDEQIQMFFGQHGRVLRNLINNARSITSLHQTWMFRGIENEGTKELADHLSNLEIPTAPYGYPSLLLHRLGEADEKMDHLVSEVFSTHGDTLLIASSGSGKTRLLLEGLCNSWGFYFTALRDSEGIGSLDLSASIAGLDNA
ncbi:hypothetical protein CPB86DRAFT_813541 [Serendipita vermifera]|nr:hypothetical protein CPB86DRAFT_813541 [Serendipita vermifera]